MKCNIRYLPDDGKRKKAVVQQAIAMPYTRPFGGFEMNRPLSSRQVKKAKLCHEGLVPVSNGSQAL